MCHWQELDEHVVLPFIHQLMEKQLILNQQNSTKQVGFVVVINPCIAVELIDLVNVSHFLQCNPNYITSYYTILLQLSPKMMFFLFLNCLSILSPPSQNLQSWCQICYHHYNLHHHLRNSIITRDIVLDHWSKSTFLNFFLANGICNLPISTILNQNDGIHHH